MCGSRTFQMRLTVDLTKGPKDALSLGESLRLDASVYPWYPWSTRKGLPGCRHLVADLLRFRSRWSSFVFVFFFFFFFLESLIFFIGGCRRTMAPPYHIQHICIINAIVGQATVVFELFTGVDQSNIYRPFNAQPICAHLFYLAY